MIDFLRTHLSDYFIYIKFVHLLFVMIWSFSTFVGAAYYVYPVMNAWRRHPKDPAVIRLRNWTMERFDEGVIYEHIAFPIVLVTGPLLYILAGYDLNTNWMNLKLLIVIGILIPIEVYDYHIAHFGGNKAKLRIAGDMTKYEKAVHSHWWFLLITTPAILIFVILVLFLAITKPAIGV